MKRFLLSLALASLLMSTADAQINTRSRNVIDDSTTTATFYIKSTNANSNTDEDTSATYDIAQWDELTAQWKFTVLAGTDDSGGVSIILAVSNDNLNWFRQDSVSSTDTLWNFGVFTLKRYKWGRFYINDNGETDEDGTSGAVIVNHWGRR